MTLGHASNLRQNMCRQSAACRLSVADREQIGIVSRLSLRLLDIGAMWLDLEQQCHVRRVVGFQSQRFVRKGRGFSVLFLL